jgi:hypothetical protein
MSRLGAAYRCLSVCDLFRYSKMPTSETDSLHARDKFATIRPQRFENNLQVILN